MKKKVAKQSKTSKPNYICDEVASKKPERHESQPTSRNQEDFGRCLHVDQSHLSILPSITDNIRDMNLKTKFTVLEIQFRHVNHTNAAMICKKHRAKQTVFVVAFKVKAVYNSSKSQQNVLNFQFKL